MEIVVLLEPLESGGFRAKAGEPFNLCAEGTNTEEATRRLAVLIDAFLAQGRLLTTLTVTNSKAVIPIPAKNEETTPLPQTPLRFEPLPDDEFFQEMSAAIAENRRLEDEAENRRLANGTATVSPPLPADDRYLTDPSFAELQQLIAEFRRAE